MTDYLVVDRPDENAYVLTRDGERVGFASYSRGPGVIAFTHTQIDPDEQEQGLGSRLVQGALDAVRDGSEDRVEPDCPFVAHFIEEHPEYRELLDRTPRSSGEERL